MPPSCRRNSSRPTTSRQGSTRHGWELLGNRKAAAHAVLAHEAGSTTNVDLDKGGEQHYQDPGYGKGQPPMQMHPMVPMMMPYQQHMMPPPLQPPVVPAPGPSTMMDKGTGKGMSHPAGMQGGMIPPPPPMPATGPISQTPGAQTSWASNMPMMPFPAAPAATAIPMPQEDAVKEGKAQKNLNRLLKEMKKEEDTLSPNLQSMAHEMKKQDEKSNMQGLPQEYELWGTQKTNFSKPKMQEYNCSRSGSTSCNNLLSSGRNSL